MNECLGFQNRVEEELQQLTLTGTLYSPVQIGTPHKVR
jgi:hypothetical protein